MVSPDPIVRAQRIHAHACYSISEACREGE